MSPVCSFKFCSSFSPSFFALETRQWQSGFLREGVRVEIYFVVIIKDNKTRIDSSLSARARVPSLRRAKDEKKEE